MPDFVEMKNAMLRALLVELSSDLLQEDLIELVKEDEDEELETI